MNMYSVILMQKDRLGQKPKKKAENIFDIYRTNIDEKSLKKDQLHMRNLVLGRDT